jgi:hypothetical protein
MTTSQSTNAADASPPRDLLYIGRYYLSGWRGVLVLAVIASLVGVGFSWSWLVAAGIAPILLSTLPCLIMCGLGLCMSCRSGEKQTTARDAADAATSSAPLAVANMDNPATNAATYCHEYINEAEAPPVKQLELISERST